MTWAVFPKSILSLTWS